MLCTLKDTTSTLPPDTHPATLDTGRVAKVLVHRNLKTEPEQFLSAIAPYRQQDLVVGVECMFTWYWLADLCNQHQIPFVLGHALYMKAIHGGKAKNDKIDSEKIAMLLRGRALLTATALSLLPPDRQETKCRVVAV